MGIKVITPPTEEQITLAIAAQHLKLLDNGDSPATYVDQTWVTSIGIPAAREYCENWMKRAIAPQTFEYTLDAFPDGAIELPYAPITSLTSVKYTDGDSVVQTLPGSAYTFDNYSEPSRVVRTVSTSWPTVLDAPNVVKVRYVAGYDLAGDSPNLNPLPFSIKAAMLLMLSHLYENRSAVDVGALAELPYGVECLLRPYQLRMSMA